MGAYVFTTYSTGPTAKAAFSAAVQEAKYESGHGGYSGTIAEKDSFVTIPLPEGADPIGAAYSLIDAEDKRIDDKNGPAGCFALGDNKYLFFGWASS